MPLIYKSINNLKMRKYFLLLFIAFLSTNCYPQMGYEKMVTDFFKTYSTNPEQALDDIFKTNEWLMKNEDGIASVKSKLNLNIGLMGEYCGYEKIVKRQLGESMVLESYLVKYERQPLRFTLKFYKPKDKWILYNFQFDEDVDEELHESAKIYFIEP